MTDASVRIRGRSTRERRIAEEAAQQVATRAAERVPDAAPARARMPDLSALTRLLAQPGELRALADRYRTVK